MWSEVVEEGQAHAFADNSATAILKQVGGWVNFDEFYAYHNLPFDLSFGVSSKA